MAETLIAQIRGFEVAAGKILAEIERAETLPKAEREMRQEDCFKRLAPIFQTLHNLTTDPKLR